MCRFRTIWRKRTRICTNSALAGIRHLCLGGHSHQQLRGRNQLSWTRVAQVYLRRLCEELTSSLAARGGLLSCERGELRISACAKCQGERIGEASNPGPPRAAPGASRDIADLFSAQLYEPSTLAIQPRVWRKFDRRLHDKFSSETCSQFFLCPLLVAQVLRQYGLE